MPGWISALVSIMAALLAAGVTVGLMKGSMQALVAGQAAMQASLSDLTRTVNLLSTASAIGASLHDELTRRISISEAKLADHSEVIRVLRTRSHMQAGKLMELDPNWKPYRDEE